MALRSGQIIIEDAGSGKPLLQELGRRRPRLSLYSSTPADSKIERMTGQLGQIEDGLVSLPDDMPWIDAFISECRAFPFGKYDDQVDTLSQYLRFAMRRKTWLENRPTTRVYSIGSQARSGMHYSSGFIN